MIGAEAISFQPMNRLARERGAQFNSVALVAQLGQVLE
jgi:hypothetical protein